MSSRRNDVRTAGQRALFRRRRIGGRVLSVLLLLAGTVLLRPETAFAADTSAPTMPGVITASNVSVASVSLAWGGSKDNVGIEGYRVYRSVGTGSLTLIATTDAVTSYSATHLYSGQTYTFGVTAIDSADNPSPMRTLTVALPANTGDTTAPAAPSSTSLSFRVFSSSRVDVVWGASSSTDVAGYRVLRNGVRVGAVDLPNTPRFSDNGLTAATTYSYSIQAVDSAGNVSAATPAKTAKTLAAGAVLIARGPYLSNVTATSATVSWWTNLATSGAVAINSNSATDTAGSVQHHSVTVTGLAAGTSYPYTVSSGSATASGTLHTAAAPGQTFSFAAIGDFGGGATGENQNAANIAGAGTQFIQTVGDDIYPSSGLPDPNFSTTYSDFDQRFFKPFATAIKSQAFFPANGNKEYYGDGEFWAAFPMPGNNHSWYSYDWGNAHILVLDTEQPYATGSDQYNFAQADLAAHQSATWRIVALQRPPYSSTTANSSSKPVQQYLVPLFQTQHVDLVLSGNSHNYERTVPLTNGVPTAGGITYLVTGAGGNGFNAFTAAAPAYSAFRESSYFQYAKVTVSPTALTVDAIRADTNAVFDTTTITAPGGGDTTAPTVPGNVAAAAINPTRIDVSWAASTDAVGVTGYKVYRDGGATAVASVASGTTYSDTAVSAGTTHSYTVTAYDAAGNESAQSSPPASATTPAAAMPAPTNLTATPSGSSQVNLTWTAVSGATSYNVFRGTAKIASPATAGYNDTGLSPNTAYSYTVTALGAAGESAHSASASATTAPTSGGTTVTVAPTDDATISKAAGNTGTNYGKATSLTVDADGTMNDFLLKFPVPTGCTPTAATLALTVGAGSTNSSTHGGDFYAAPGTWAETTVTADNAPAVTGSPVSLGAVAVSTAYSLNVTPLLSGISGGILSLRATTTSNDAAAYVSKDATTGSTAGPHLTFTC